MIVVVVVVMIGVPVFLIVMRVLVVHMLVMRMLEVGLRHPPMMTDANGRGTTEGRAFTPSRVTSLTRLTGRRRAWGSRRIPIDPRNHPAATPSGATGNHC